jgi:acyl-CoA reductase-like NAD-dependent aldehyde dehydrogenase
MLIEAADRIETHADQIGRLLTLEQGKPLAAAIGEAQHLAKAFRFFAKLDLVPEVLESTPQRRVVLHRRALGVVGAIVPWNFPLSLFGFKAPPALIAGNTVILKPASTTPMSTLKVAELLFDVFPPGVFNVLADEDDLGPLMTAHPGIQKISFTGSTQTGQKVMAGAAANLKRVTLELGGNDAAIVLADVNVPEVAANIFQQAFRNAGQLCIAPKRVYVHATIYDAFCAEMARLAEAARVGDGLAPDTQIGPLQNPSQLARVLGYIDDARERGHVIAGGDRPDGPGFFVRPTIVRDIDDAAAVVREEQFGPVLPILRFDDIDEAVQRANACDYGLGGSVWSTDVARATEIAGRIEAGTVWVNKHAELLPTVPFGGAKMSGIGLELGQRGLEEFTQVQIINTPAVRTEETVGS